MKFIVLLFSILLTFSAWSQLQTNGGQSPGQLVQNVLLGTGVDVSNVSYSGSSSAIGTFDATNASIGLDEGIIMTTGTVHQGPDGPYGPNDKPNAGMDNNASGYGQLSNLVGEDTYNASLLEFDFIPNSDTVRFRYVFASEEYPEYVGSQFNDVFAFFISGPGIAGGTKNMAIIPGTNQAVAINNVNHQQNTNFYQGNGDGSEAPYNADPYYVEYDGFTKPLEAVSAVECGEKYHLIIAVADVGDPIYDSGIFLEKNSLNSEQPVQVDYELSSDPYGDGKTMAQGCTSAEVTITRTGNMINQSLTIPINVSGSAVEGLDYSAIPNSVTFSPGETSVSFTIDALNNPNLVGLANLVLQFEIEDPCGNSNYQAIELFIKPVEPVSVSVETPDIVCPGDDIELTAEASGGGGGYDFLWNTGETTQSITVNPASTQTFIVEVTDECLNQTASDSATVEIPEYDSLMISATDDIVEQCPFTPHDLNVEAVGGAGEYSYQWINPDGNTIGVTPSINVSVYSTSTFVVVVSDQCGGVDTTTVTITILSSPIELEITREQKVCLGDSVQLTVNPTGGFGDYHYNWTHSDDTTQSIWVKPEETTRYTVIVKDDCQNFQVLTHTNVVVLEPDVDFNIITDPKFVGLPITFHNLTNNGESYYWDFGNGATSTMTHPNNTYYGPGSYDVTLIGRDRNGCVDSITKPLEILDEVYLYIPNSFSPGTSIRYNETFKVSAIGIVELNVKIFNRWGELLFSSNKINFEWDGRYDGELVKDGTYIWKIDYKSIHDEDPQTISGHINVLR